MAPRLRLSTRYGINTAILIALALSILAIAGTLSYRHNWRKDFTSNKRRSLSEQTVNVLDDLKTEVKVTAFVWKSSPAYEEVKELFDMYRYESKMIEFRLIDPDLNPGLAGEYDIGRYKPPVAFLETDMGRETITAIDEEQATNALIKVSRGAKKLIYFLTGHGEHSLDDTTDNALSIAKKLLQDKHYDPQPLLLMRAEEVPEDTAALVVCGPQKDVTAPELDMIKDFIEAGGRTLFLVDPEAPPSLALFLEQYGIQLGNDVVIDRMSRLFGGDYLMPIPTEYSDHPIMHGFNVTPFFPVVRSVSLVEKPGVKTSWLFRTGDRSWAETDMEALRQGKATLDPDDTPGPISLAAVSEIDTAGPIPGQASDAEKAAVVVFGDSDFVSNARINLSGNADLFMNVVHWLGKEETLMAIPPKRKEFSPLVMAASEFRVLALLSIIVLPGIVFAGGIVAFVRRSRHP